MSTSETTIGSVESVVRYPVKSMVGEVLQNWVRLDARGLNGDRAYALVDADDGTVASAKHPRKWGRLLTCHAAYVDEPADSPTTSPPPVQITLPDGATVRSDETTAEAVLSRVIGRPVRLATRPPPEAGYEDVWPDVDGVAPPEIIARTRVTTDDPSETVSRFRLALAAPPGTFFDVAPVHLLTTASIERARQLYPKGQFATARFRPNLLIRTPSGVVDFVENAWVGRRLRIGDVVLEVTLRVPRCVMTALPQGDLPSDLGILRTLASHNRVEFGRLGRWACLGVYASVLQAGTVRPGDPVVLEDTGAP
jgi:uncharacterized protein YcbX